MNIASVFKKPLPLVVVASIGLGPLYSYITYGNSKTVKFSYDFSNAKNFKLVDNPDNRFVQFKHFDEISQFNYKSDNNEPDFIATILKFYSQQRNKEAITSTNKSFPESWKVSQSCSLQIDRQGEPFYFNVSVSSSKSKQHKLSNIIVYNVIDSIYTGKKQAKVNSLLNSLVGDSSISVVIVTYAGDLCSQTSVLNESGMAALFNIIENKRQSVGS